MKKLLANYTKKTLHKLTSSVNFSEMGENANVGMSPSRNFLSNNRSAAKGYINRSQLLDSVGDRETMAATTQRSYTNN